MQSNLVVDITGTLKEGSYHPYGEVVHFFRLIPPWRNLYRTLRIPRTQVSLYCEDISTLPRPFFFIALLFAARSRRAVLTDAVGAEQVVSGVFFLKAGIRCLFEVVAAIALVPISYLTGILYFWWLHVAPLATPTAIPLDTIAYVRTDYPGSKPRVGGSFSHTDGLLKGLLKLGKSAVILSPGRVSSIDEAIVPYCAVIFRHFRNVPEIASVLYNVTLLRAGRRLLRSDRPSLIYARHDGFMIAPLMLARAFRVPLFLEVNGLETWVRQRWGRLSRKRLCRLYERITLYGARTIFVVSQVLADDLVAFGVPRGKIIVNPNGVDEEAFEHSDGSVVRDVYQLDKRPLVGFVGTFGQWHGVEILAKAISKVIEKRAAVRFLLIGEGKLRSAMEQILEQTKVTDYAIFAGLVPHTEMKHYLAACTVLVSPHIPNHDGSRFFGSPTKLFEYMISGKGIVASRLDQIAEVLEHNKTAYLVEPGNADELSRGIIHLLDNPQLCDALGQSARNVALEHYTWSHNAHRVIEAYRKMV